MKHNPEVTILLLLIFLGAQLIGLVITNEYLDKETLEQVEAVRLHYKKVFLKLNEKTLQGLYL